MSKEDFFIGWADLMPRGDRRMFLAGGLGLSLGALGGGGFLASRQATPGPGQWDQGAVRTFTGIATAEPYAMLRTQDIDGYPQTVFLSCMGKCGVAARIGAYAGQAVTIRGSVIRRDEHVMIAVVDDMDWIGPASGTREEDGGALAFPALEDLGEVKLKGTILDTKCWFGAMRPAAGKVHKACAALCIRGGVPPAFFATDRTGRTQLLIMVERGGPCGDDILPLVADPVEMTGRVLRAGEWLLVDTGAQKLRRL